MGGEGYKTAGGQNKYISLQIELCIHLSYLEEQRNLNIKPPPPHHIYFLKEKSFTPTKRGGGTSFNTGALAILKRGRKKFSPLKEKWGVGVKSFTLS